MSRENVDYSPATVNIAPVGEPARDIVFTELLTPEQESDLNRRLFEQAMQDRIPSVFKEIARQDQRRRSMEMYED